MRIIFFIFFALFLNLTYANNTDHLIVIDIGDDYSTLHIFKSDRSQSLPMIEDIWKEANFFSVAKLCDQPEQAAETLRPLLINAEKKLKTLQIDPHLVPLRMYGTESMRLLSEEKQHILYERITQFIQKHYSFSVKEARSMSRETQGIYQWLTINYLAQNFNQTKTIGSLYLSDFFGTIAFAIPHSFNPQYEQRIKINNQSYLIFSRGFSDLGRNTLLEKMKEDKLASYCFPINYALKPEIKGHFSFPECQSIYQNLLQPYALTANLPPMSTESFVAFDHIHQSYEFLGAEDPDQAIFEIRLNYVCKTPWEYMKLDYDIFPEKQLSELCAHTVLVDQLIYRTLHLTGNQLWITDKINSKKIEWPLGAVLYQTQNQSAPRP